MNKFKKSKSLKNDIQYKVETSIGNRISLKKTGIDLSYRNIKLKEE